MRYLPSLVATLILLGAILYADRGSVRNIEHQRRDVGVEILQRARHQIAHATSASLRLSRTLAGRFSQSPNIKQQSFENAIKRLDTGKIRIVRAELAPGFVTEFVYPADERELYLGRSPLQPPDNMTIASYVARGFPSAANVTISGSTLELTVRSNIRELKDEKITLSGLLSLVVQYDLSILDSDGPLGEVEFLGLAQLKGKPPPKIPVDWEQDEPVAGTVPSPFKDYYLYLRPVSGWTPTSAEMVIPRFKLAGIGLLLLLPVILANWFVVTSVAAGMRLSRAESQLRYLLKNLPGIAFTYTVSAAKDATRPAAKLRLLNPEILRQIYGVEPAMVERNVMNVWNQISNPEAAEALSATLKQSLRSMSPVNVICPIDLPNGEQRWINGRGQPVLHEDGTVQWTAIVFDSSDAVKRDIELKEQRELAFRAQKNETVGQLTGGMAHDFNNLLSVISANLELLAVSDATPIQRRCLQAALDATYRGADLTRNMLAFARRAPLTPECFNINDVVRELRDWLERTLPATVEVKIALSEDLDYVRVDRSSTENALLNLIVNSRDAMNESGLLTIGTKNQTIAEENYVVLTVADTGSGISEKHLEHIFEPFYTTKQTSSGSGLGLSMISGFLQQSDGFVDVATEIDIGTSISLHFPAVEGPISSVAVQAPDIANKRDTSDVNILLVEDHVAVRDALSNLLQHDGYNVMCVASGDEALAIFNRDPAFDLLLTDMVMPGNLQGLALAKALREKCESLPVIFMSGYADQKIDIGESYVSFIKPVKHTDIIAAIEQLVARELVS